VLATYIPVRIIEQVENNDTRRCKYLLFHLPFTLLLCDTLQLHPSSGSTLLRDILLQQVKRIKQIDAQPPRQFGPEEVMSVVASAANF
jgi:transcriptional regulator of met regulon